MKTPAWKANRRTIQRIVKYLARKVDPARDSLGNRLLLDEPNELRLADGPAVPFPALNELRAAYQTRYPNQIFGFKVGREILEAALNATGPNGKSVGASVYFGVLPRFEETLPLEERLLWEAMYKLQQLLSREPRQLIIVGYGPDGQDLPLADPRAASEGIPPTKGTIAEEPSPRQYAFIPNIVMGDRGMGGETLPTCPPN